MEIDYQEELEFIAQETGFDVEVIEKVINADMAFLQSKGIVEVDE